MKPILLALLAAGPIFAQTAPTTCATISPAAAKSEFDTTAIARSSRFGAGSAFSRGGLDGIVGGPGTNSPGRITAVSLPLITLVMTAYDLPIDQITAPDWTRDFINNGFALSATMPVTTTREEYCGMLRNLLTSRFQLTFHRETQPRPAYELTALPAGPKFRKYDPKDPGPDAVPGAGADKNGFPLMPPGQAKVLSKSLSPNGLLKVSFRDSMDRLAADLGGDINQSNGVRVAGAPIPRVVDKTGLTGIYDIRFAFATGRVIMGGLPAGTTGVPASVPVAPVLAPDIFSALQAQTGLKLTKTNDVSVEVLIIDRIDQTPAKN